MPGVRVYDTNDVLVAEYDVIQQAIFDNSTLPGYRVEVDNHEYVGNEFVQISKKIILTTTAFKDVDPASGARKFGAAITEEVVLKGVVFEEGGATLNGFTIDGGAQPNNSIGVLVGYNNGDLDSADVARPNIVEIGRASCRERV